MTISYRSSLNRVQRVNSIIGLDIFVDLRSSKRLGQQRRRRCSIQIVQHDRLLRELSLGCASGGGRTTKSSEYDRWPLICTQIGPRIRFEYLKPMAAMLHGPT